MNRYLWIGVVALASACAAEETATTEDALCRDAYQERDGTWYQQNGEEISHSLCQFFAVCDAATLDETGDCRNANGDRASYYCCEGEAIDLGEPETAANELVQGISIADDILTVSLRYTGCANDNFSLYWDGSLENLTLSIGHDANGTCRFPRRTDERFDLTSLKESYWAQNGGAAGSLDIELGDHSVLYEFDASPIPPVQFGEPSDPIAHDSEIQAIEIDGDTLLVQVRYGGGCEEHEWGLFFNGENLADGAQLTLSHNSNGDFCEALLSEELRFDLTPLKELYWANNNGARGSFEIELGERTAPYGFDARPAPAIEFGEPSDPAAHDSEILSIELDGDILVIQVRYGGGCEEHEWGLFWNGDSLEDNAQLVLSHNTNGDFCEGLRGEELRFDLTPLKEAYLAGHDGTEGSLEIELGDHSALYEFGGSDIPSIQVGEPSDPVAHASEIRGVNLDGDILVIQVSYAGGCEEHEWGLFWSGEPFYFDPRLSLSHNANGDLCEALVSEELRFDVRSLREAHEEFFAPDSWLVTLGIGDHNASMVVGDAPEVIVGLEDVSLAREGEIKGVRIVGDHLVVEVEYGGGCEEHAFRLFWDRDTSHLQLSHEGPLDLCEGLYSPTLIFDLTPIREQLGGENGEVALVLEPYEAEHRVDYIWGAGAD